MRQFSFITLFFASLFLSHAQNNEASIDEAIQEFVMTLPQEASSSMFSVKRYCNGSVKMFMMNNGSQCITNGDYIEAYLFFKQNDSVWVKKFDNCGSFKKLALEDSAAFEHFTTNIDSIGKQEVKPFKTAQESTQPLARATVYRCHRSFAFYNKEEITTQTYSLYALSNEGLQPNINYDYNNALNMVTLDAMLDPVLSKAQENNSFKRN